MNTSELIKRQGDHHNLICYRKAELLFDMTYHFVHTAFVKGDRTIDQMVQAARSGKQNIVEGNAAIETSLEMGIKLLNVAKASFQELLSDYEDYLRVNDFRQWETTSKEYMAMRELGVKGDNAHILTIAKSRPLDTVANMAIILLKQEDYLLHQLLKSLSNRFVKEGGFKERMYRVRMQEREAKGK
ncbi:MAG: four helix bundle suffix domain-containing protein [Tidjanibacter sp.]|nr:four helix bundle suffix domain-containing protein [Tidjanibacter sp.]